jgi:hypothetical protein
MLHNVLVMAHTCVDYVCAIAGTLGKNVSAAQVNLSQQELEYPAIVKMTKGKMFLTALGMGLAPVENVSAERYEP